MEEQTISGGASAVDCSRDLKLEEDEEEEFRSCCDDESEMKEREEAKEDLKDSLDEFSATMFFKGVSIAKIGESGAGLSGIGVVIERTADIPSIQVQKKLAFHVDESMANYLALMDGLLEAARNKIVRVFAFTDSPILYDQIVNDQQLDNPLLLALRQRVLEQAETLDIFVLKLAPHVHLEKPERLAQVAIGVVSSSLSGEDSLDNCSICCEDKQVQMMLTLRCSHKFCSHCMQTYVDGKVQFAQVPVRCPQSKCRYCISTAEFRSFLPVVSYEMLERAYAEANILNSENMYCPFPNCSIRLDHLECLSTRASSSSQSYKSSVSCPACQRLVCLDCAVPWHFSMSCEEYQNLPSEERDTGLIALHHLAANRRWRCCEQCQQIIELRHGCCYQMICRCGLEFCYSCGSDYRDGERTCHCAFEDEDNNNQDLVARPIQESEQWAWDSFDLFPMMTDAYSDQERSQLALIQRFLAGGFSLSDHHSYQPPPSCTDSYADTIKDLHQLPWLESFVSVISDNYYDEYNQ